MSVNPSVRTIAGPVKPTFLDVDNPIREKHKVKSTAADIGNGLGRVTYLRKGIPMAQIRATDSADVGYWMPCQAGDTTGLDVCEGLLGEDVDMLDPDTKVAADQDVVIVTGGVTKEEVILIDYSAAPLTRQQVMEDFGFRRGTKKQTIATGVFTRPAVGTAGAGSVIVNGETCFHVRIGALAGNK
jgi:hypothetical protein